MFGPKPHIHYNLTDGICSKFPIQAVPSELFAHVLPLNIDAWVQTVGVSLVVVVVRVRECSSFSSSSCSTSILADLTVFVRALEGSGCELYLAVMMMVERVKDTDGTIPANSTERFFVPCCQ